MNDIRNNGKIGFFELVGLDDKPICLHFSEWWNGEGLDFTLGVKNERHISLHSDEILLIASAAIATGYLSIKEVKEHAKRTLEESKLRKKRIEEISKTKKSDSQGS